jgi:hypothetical protein
MSAESVKTKPERRLKRGDVREDGKVFWAYDRSVKSGEHWTSPEKFAEMRAKLAARDAKRQLQPPKPSGSLRRGEVIGDKVVWGYHRSGNPYLVTTEKYRALLHKQRVVKREYVRERRSSDPLFRLSHRVRSNTARMARLAKSGKPAGSFNLLGTDLQQFKDYIESLFVDGMGWHNMGEWELDHRVPLSSAKTTDELWALAHYSNLQPLWTLDNRKKGAKSPN